MKRDILGRLQVHKELQLKTRERRSWFNLWFNWRPEVLALGADVVLSKDYIQIEVELWFVITISIIWR